MSHRRSVIVQLGHWRVRLTVGRFVFGAHRRGPGDWSVAAGIGMVSALRLKTTDWTIHRYTGQSHTSRAMRRADQRASKP